MHRPPKTRLSCFEHISTHGAIPWPAISDICLGMRTVPVLCVAKEVVALPVRWIAVAADRPYHTGRAKQTDRSTIECEEILSLVCLSMFPSLLLPWPKKIETTVRTWHRRVICRACTRLCLACVPVSIFFGQGSRSTHRARAAHRVPKADVLRESKKIGMVPEQ